MGAVAGRRYKIIYRYYVFHITSNNPTFLHSLTKIDMHDEFRQLEVNFNSFPEQWNGFQLLLIQKFGNQKQTLGFKSDHSLFVCLILQRSFNVH